MAYKKNTKTCKKQVKYTPAQWATIRASYESGTCTLGSLSKAWNLSLSALKQRSVKDGWQKGKLAPAIEQRIREKTVDILAELGMTKRRLLELVVQGAERTEKLANVKVPLKNQNGEIIRDQMGKPYIVDQTITVIDNTTTFRYREEIAKLAGWYAPGKTPITSTDDEAEVQAQGERQVVKELKSLSIEKLRKLRGIIGKS